MTTRRSGAGCAVDGTTGDATAAGAGSGGGAGLGGLTGSTVGTCPDGFAGTIVGKSNSAVGGPT